MLGNLQRLELPLHWHLHVSWASLCTKSERLINYMQVHVPFSAMHLDDIKAYIYHDRNTNPTVLLTNDVYM